MDTGRFSGNRDLGLLLICNPSGSLLHNPVGGNLGSSSRNPMISVGGTPIFERGLVLSTTLRYPGSINYESICLDSPLILLVTTGSPGADRPAVYHEVYVPLS